MKLPFKKMYPDAQLFYTACLKYFTSATENKGCFSPMGLRLSLDVTHQAMSAYAGLDDYALVCEWSKLMCEDFQYRKMVTENKPVASIFTLKAKYGWSDQPAIKVENNTFIYAFGNEIAQLRASGNKQIAPAKSEPLAIEVEVVDIQPVEAGGLTKQQVRDRNREYQRKFRAKAKELKQQSGDA